jgi:hypothetical protein
MVGTTKFTVIASATSRPDTTYLRYDRIRDWIVALSGKGPETGIGAEVDDPPTSSLHRTPFRRIGQHGSAGLTPERKFPFVVGYLT